ncbi:MAG: Hpt domain-containing protein [Chloroflexi bacterium]|nr:Hpt domain-containing protein [Chloroflexota bacterium]
MQSGLLDLNTITTLLELNDPTESSNFFVELVNEFLAQATHLIAAIKQAIHQNDRRNLIPHLHNLKGASLNMGAIALAEACETLESSIEKGQLAEIDSWPAKLELIYSETVQAMEQIKKPL